VRALIVNIVCTFLLSGCAIFASKEALVGCQAADTTTTLHATSLGAREVNPFVHWLLETTGPGGFIAVKAAVTLLVIKVHPEMPADLVRLVNGELTAWDLLNRIEIPLDWDDQARRLGCWKFRMPEGVKAYVVNP
jgi:hypothetical protein